MKNITPAPPRPRMNPVLRDAFGLLILSLLLNGGLIWALRTNAAQADTARTRAVSICRAAQQRHALIYRFQTCVAQETIAPEDF